MFAIISKGQNHNSSMLEITSVNGISPFGSYVRIQVAWYASSKPSLQSYL